jgi:3-oxoacyl-[acyl-carrier-protein] synthase II
VSAAIHLVGAGAITPIGHDRRAFAAALAQTSAATPKTAVGDLDLASLPEPKALRRAAPHVLFGVAAAAEAAREAGGGVAPEDVGVVLASSLGSVNFSYRLWQELLKSGALGASPVLFSEGVPNALAGHVARSLRMLGPGHMLGGGSDAGLRAVVLARDLLEAGRARRVLVGAAEEGSELADRARQRLGLSPKPPRESTTRRRAAITRGRAFVAAEGGAALVLERGAARPLATLLAVESVQLHGRDREQNAVALAALVQRALDSCGRAPRDVAWLGTAANGTTIDRWEEPALARLAIQGFAPQRSTRVRAAAGDALTVTPLLQVIEALPIAASDRIAGVLSISQFGAASFLLLGPVEDAAAR